MTPTILADALDPARPVDVKKLPMYERPDICGPCGGSCCKRMPGAAMPEDFGSDIGAVEAALSSGLWSLDWWEGDPRFDSEGIDDVDRGIFLRPRIVGAPVVHPAWGGRCSWLGDAGCLRPESRPSGCRGLEPGDEDCVARYASKLDAAKAWLPFADALEELTERDWRTP